MFFNLKILNNFILKYIKIKDDRFRTTNYLFGKYRF